MGRGTLRNIVKVHLLVRGFSWSVTVADDEKFEVTELLSPGGLGVCQYQEETIRAKESQVPLAHTYNPSY
jgi:hypothetical protein